MKGLYVFLAGFLLIPCFVFAQEKLFTAEDASFNNPSLYARGPAGLCFIPETDLVSYVKNDALIQYDITTGKTDTLLKLNHFNQILIQNNLKAGKSFPSLSWINKDQIRFSINRKILIYNLSGGILDTLGILPENAENIDYSSNGLAVAYTVANNLFILTGRNVQPVSNEPNPGILYGSERVHRNEFGISKGTFWSPDGMKLAFYRMDETMVTDYPLIDITTRPAVVNPTKYPMAGMSIHKVTLGVYDLLTGRTVYLDTSIPFEHYLTNITWSPDGGHIYIAILNREQNQMWLNRYNALNGQFEETLLEESNPRYVEPENGPWFIPGNPELFVWQSERSGFNHLYLYDIQGNLIQQLTDGNWMVSDITGYHSESSSLIITANCESPLQNDIYTVSIKNSVIKRLSQETGWHTALTNSSGAYILDIWSGPDVPRTIHIYSIRGTRKITLHNGSNPLKEYQLGKTRVFEIHGDDGTPLFCRMITPPGFDSTQKYPVIVYVYGGPHNQLINKSWLYGASLYLHYLAQKGYIVFSLDNRGSANRGFEFESVIHRQVGKYEAMDQMAGIQFLQSLPYVDTKRLGIDGWSYGGFMSINLLLENPGIFKAGCAGGPVCDWKYYEAMYGERYMDTPESNPEGYKAASLLEKASLLEDKLLIIHCTTDPVVVWQHSIDFVGKCIENGILIDYFFYPGHEHNVRGKDRAHLIRKITDFFDRNL